MTSTPHRRRCDAKSADVSPIRVLIVDDDPDYRAYLSALVRRLGLQTNTAADGEQALAMIRGAEFDLLLSDFEMPRMNGLELIAAVRGEEQLGALYAVMLTAHEEVSLKIQALEQGFDDFLQKRCDEVEVMAKVAAARRMLARQRALDTAMREWRGIASRDELTGVYTRRFFYDEAARVMSEGRPIGVVLIDLDDFKKINDTYGHLAGDRVLRDVGALFLSRTRVGDVIARFGGDEFVLLISDCQLEESRQFAARIVEEIGSLQWTMAEHTVTVHATTGVGCSAFLQTPTVDQLLDAADRDLYAHKWLRKNPDATAEDLYRYQCSHQAEVVRLPEPLDVRDIARNQKK